MLCLDGGFLYRAKWIFTNDFRPMFLFCFDLLNNFDISSVRFCCFVSLKLIVRLLAQADKLNSNKWNAHINNILYCAKWKSLDIIFSSLFFKKKKEWRRKREKNWADMSNLRSTAAFCCCCCWCFYYIHYANSIWGETFICCVYI